VILEVDLNDLIGEAEHDGMFRSHPFLDVYGAGWVLELAVLVDLVPLDELLFFMRVIVLL
jgi:hypothetical protein